MADGSILNANLTGGGQPASQPAALGGPAPAPQAQQIDQSRPPQLDPQQATERLAWLNKSLGVRDLLMTNVPQEAQKTDTGLDAEIESLRANKNSDPTAPWIDKTWQAMRQSASYHALPQAQREALDEIGTGMKRFEKDRTTAGAAVNLAQWLKDGKLADDKGLKTLQQLRDGMRKDAAAGPYPNTSDAILTMGDERRLSRLRDGGASPPLDTAEQVRKAAQVSSDIRGRMNSSNRPWGAFVDGSKRLGAAAWDAFSLGTTRMSAAAWGEPAVTDQDRIGINGTRQRELDEDCQELPSAQSPQGRLNGARTAERMGNIALRQGWGNCMECAAASATALHKKGFSNVEIMHKRGDEKGDHNHAFVVLNRAPDSNPRDPKTWGDKAIIVDAWNGGEAYKAGEWSKRLPGEGPIESYFRLPDP